MNKIQTHKEIEYKMSVQLLDILLVRKLITSEQYRQIDALNRESFSPLLNALLDSF